MCHEDYKLGQASKISHGTFKGKSSKVRDILLMKFRSLSSVLYLVKSKILWYKTKFRGMWNFVSSKLIHIECECVLYGVAFSCISVDLPWRVIIAILPCIRPEPSWCQMNAFLVRKSLLTICVRLNASSGSLISRLIILIVFMGEHKGGSRWVMGAHAHQTCGISCPWALHQGFSGHLN